MAFASRTTSLAVFEAATDRGFRFHLGFGAASEGRLLGGVALLQLSGSWGLRYRTGDSRAGALGGMPDWYLDWFMIDPILEADGCIYTDPSSIGRIKIICVGTPDPIDRGTIVHTDGRRFPVGLHVWIDKADGTLMTEDRQILAKPDAQTAKLAIVVQQIAELVKRREQQTGKPCFLRGGTLHTVQSPAFAATLAHDDFGGGASLLGYELARMIFCGGEPLAGGVPPMLPFGKRLGSALRSGNQKVADLIEHQQPAATPTSAAPSAPARPQPVATEPASILTAESRKHIFNGDVKTKGNRATGWHYEPTGDKNKGTHVIEGTRSQPDPSGVYQGDVMVEGVRKSARTSFFPKDWTEKQVESAIEEAYKNKRPSEKADGFVGKTASGMEVEMFLDQKGSISTAYPIYKGSAATKGK